MAGGLDAGSGEFDHGRFVRKNTYVADSTPCSRISPLPQKLLLIEEIRRTGINCGSELVRQESDYKKSQQRRDNLQTLKSRLVAGFSWAGLVSFWLTAPACKSALYKKALVR